MFAGIGCQPATSTNALNSEKLSTAVAAPTITYLRSGELVTHSAALLAGCTTLSHP